MKVQQSISLDHAGSSCQKLRETLSLYGVKDQNNDVYSIEENLSEEKIQDVLSNLEQRL